MEENFENDDLFQLENDISRANLEGDDIFQEGLEEHNTIYFEILIDANGIPYFAATS